MQASSSPIMVGTAGWAIPRQWRDEFPAAGSTLERYAARFPCAEINSSFYRQHRRATYERWGGSVPAEFRFAVKLPRAITHDQRLVAADVLLEVFLAEVQGLGARLGPLLVQLPPSLAYDEATAADFFGTLRTLHGGDVACEPRHESWFTPSAESTLRGARVARAGADPARWPAAALPGGEASLVYLRLHGSPHMYRSTYTAEQLGEVQGVLAAGARAGARCWCIFDNTTLGAAAGDALALLRAMR